MMFLSRLFAFVTLVAVTIPVVTADPPATPGEKSLVELPKFDPDKLADPKEAAKAIEILEKKYPAPQPEAVKMFIAILKGSQLTGSDGWFGPAQTRYTWKWLAKQQDVDAKTGSIEREKFRGPVELFDKLDRDGSETLTASDLDWSDRNPYVMQANMITRLFRRLDTSGDGKLTKEEMDAFFKFASAGKDSFTAEDLRQLMTPRGRGGFSRGDGPTIPVLVRGLYAGEVGSIQEGPKLDALAPDFMLKTVDGQKTVQLSKLIGEKPIFIVFGNFTCGPFRALYPDVESLYKKYHTKAHFLMVYVREAHPLDGWKMESNTRLGVAVKQPTTTEERAEVCAQFRKKLNPGMPVLVDEISDPTGNAYSGMPARLYVIDTKGKVAYKSGRGPFGFKPGEAEQALVMSLLEKALDEPKP